MQNKSQLKRRILIIVIAMFAGHIAMDLFKVGVKDGQATLHTSAKIK
ncbi:hypothetical protein [Mucilaginibacter sp.]